MIRRIYFSTILVCFALASAASQAEAQVSRSGPTFMVGGTTVPTIYPDAAFDPVNNRYLVVSGNGFIEGQLVAATGGVVRTFTVNAGRAIGQYAQTPRVAYSPDITGGGGFLVTWHASFGVAPNEYSSVMGRMFTADGTPLTGDLMIGPGAPRASSHWIMGADIAYSTASHEFLVVWMGNFLSTQDIFFTRVNLAGGLLQGSTRLGPGTADWERDPSVAYNPNQDEFYLLWAGYVEAGGYGYAAGQRVKAGTGQLLGGTTELHRALGMRVTALTYNTTNQEYLAAWHTSVSGGQAFYGAVLTGSTGAISGGIRLLSNYFVAYDALDVDYNQRSGDYALVTHGRGSEVWEDAVVPINGSGNPIDNGFIATHTTDVRALKGNPAQDDGNYNPRITASTTEKKWLLVTSSVFKAVHGQFIQSSGTAGTTTPAPAPAPAPAPSPASSRPAMAIDHPRPNSSAPGGFAVVGWALDLGSTSGVGVDAVHIWAFPTSGAPAVFLGGASLGVARPDVGAAFGDARFSTSGFSLSAALPPGVYDIVSYAHSSVANAFNNSQGVRLTITAPLSNPRMVIDIPVQNQDVSQNFTIAGWALDLGAPGGTGVDAVHVWAFPTSGAPALFMGGAQLGDTRPDVGAAFGSSRFTQAGYHLVLNGKLPPGTYDLAAYAHSVVTGSFNNASVVRITVR
jgi:hypothetical protein